MNKTKLKPILKWAGGKKVSEYSKRELTKMLRSKESDYFGYELGACQSVYDHSG